MPTVINRVQQVLHAGIYPISMYSRVVCLMSQVPAEKTFYRVVSPRLGNDLWILRIAVRLKAKAPDSSQYTSVWFYAGVGEPVDITAFEAWRNLLPVHTFPKTIWGHRFYDGCDYDSWNMAVRLKGDATRLAMVVYRVGEDTDHVEAQFQISEG